LVVGVLISPFVAAMAFLITLEEYSHHMSRSKAIRMSLQTGGVAALVMFVIVVLAGLVYAG
jgi:hypothetical protein